MKKNCIVFSLIIFSIIKLYSENIIYELGPKTDQIVVFTASRDVNNEETFSTTILHKLAQKLNAEKLNGKVIIAITDNDEPNLPKPIPAGGHKNTKDLIGKIHEKKYSAVFILSDGAVNTVKITAGSGRRTSPAWMLSTLFTQLKKDKINIEFNPNNIILRRLGFLPDNKILAEYLNEEIPAIELSTNIDITDSLMDIANMYSQNIPYEWDKHYNVKKLFGYRIISERILTIVMIAVILIGLFYIFMFSFLFGKKKEKHIKDLLKLWSVPILFFIINLISFYLSEYIVLLIFRLRFGTADFINELPLAAVIFKFALGFMISSIILLLNKKVNLPQSTFIYGYLTSLVCFLNIFIFSSFDLSLSILFLEIYILSVISCQFNKIYFQIIFLLLNIVILLFYFSQIFFKPDNLIAPLFYANNAAASFFVTPYYLMVSRLFIKIQKDNHKSKITGLIIRILMGCISACCLLIILFQVYFIQQNDKEFFIICKIENQKKSAEAVVNSRVIPATEDDLKIIEELKNINENNFISVKYQLKNYFERSIGEIKVTQLLKSTIINILITREDGFPIYEADSEFTTSASGNTISFLSPLNTSDDFSIKFSGEKDNKLSVKINAWFYGELPELTLKKYFEENKNKKLIFQITKTFSLKPQEKYNMEN